MDGSIRQVAPGIPLDMETWSTICRANNRSASRPQVAFEVLDAGERPHGYGEVTEYTPGRWTLHIACCNACEAEKRHNLLNAIAEAVRERGGDSIETTIEYASSDTLELFQASGMRIASLVSYGGEAALVLRVDRMPTDQPGESASRSASTSAAASTTIGK